MEALASHSLDQGGVFAIIALKAGSVEDLLDIGGRRGGVSREDEERVGSKVFHIRFLFINNLTQPTRSLNWRLSNQIVALKLLTHLIAMAATDCTVIEKI